MDRSPARILSIAGSDSSGGAGIQADIKTITMLGGYAMTAITAITAQNTRGVQALETSSVELVLAQIDSCLSDIGADAIKIGMLGSPAVAHAVADRLDGFGGPIVFDPVMVATSGAELAGSETIAAFDRLLAIATLTTPNLPELAVLSGSEPVTSDAILEAAMALAKRHGVQVLAKGGHRDDAEVLDYIASPSGKFASFGHARIDTRHTHGTGCTLSAAMATLLGFGQPLTSAIQLARAFTYRAIEHAPGFGEGNGPLGQQAVRRLD
jgi:hydroxymethylpyrimidine/phosphomethylpyrimidine kinase